MSRLTKRINHHYTPKKDIRLGAYSECVQKLGRLEDLEEQGRLIELPCKVGDTVYSILAYYKPRMYRKSSAPSLGYLITERPFTPNDTDAFGESIFLTKEEAEAKLKELKGE